MPTPVNFPVSLEVEGYGFLADFPYHQDLAHPLVESESPEVCGKKDTTVVFQKQGGSLKQFQVIVLHIKNQFLFFAVGKRRGVNKDHIISRSAPLQPQ